MELKVLKSSIKTAIVPNFLIFEVHEQALAKQYIKSISDVLGKDCRYFNTAKEALYDIETSLMVDALYIIYNDTKSLTDSSILLQLKSCGRHVIFYNLCDASISVSKDFKDSVVSFPKLDNYTLLAYALILCKNHRCTIDQEKLEKIVDLCDCDLGILINELDKIFILEQDNSNVLVDYFINNNFIDYHKNDVVTFVNALLNRDKSCINMLYSINETTIYIITMLHSMARSRLKSTGNTFYGTVMHKSCEIYTMIMEEKVDSLFALKSLVRGILRI